MNLPARSTAVLSVSAIGLGGAPLSEMPMVSERERALATIQRALDLGVKLIDTAASYAPTWDTFGHNESLIEEAVRTYAGPADLTGLVIATKGGVTRGEAETWGRDGSADGLRRDCEASLRRLNAEAIELYHLHCHDPDRSFAEQVRALAALAEQGLVRRIGLSNVTIEELSVALDIVGGPTDGGVVSVQNEYSPRYRGGADVLDRCTESGIAFLAWSPLGGTEQAHDIGSRYAAFAQVGAELGATPQETVLAWLLRVSPVVIPIPGATRPVSIESSARAARIELTDDQFARLQATKPAGDSRYPDDMARSPLGH